MQAANDRRETVHAVIVIEHFLMLTLLACSRENVVWVALCTHCDLVESHVENIQCETYRLLLLFVGQYRPFKVD
jgi:hypothetical protein